jgi:flagellin-specific chaperone FliS
MERKEAVATALIALYQYVCNCLSAAPKKSATTVFDDGPEFGVWIHNIIYLYRELVQPVGRVTQQMDVMHVPIDRPMLRELREWSKTLERPQTLLAALEYCEANIGTEIGATKC